jgi:hypothetical protein
MTQYTPGPWKQGSTHPENVNAGSALVCTTLSRGRFNDEQKANARLISAAPELLDALKDALCALECCGKDYPAASKARTAIAKAIGEK